MKRTELMTYNLWLMTAVILAVLLVIGHESLVANAQAPAQVILTWSAQNFYPADFQGKAAVTPGTPVAVGVEVVKNSKLLDLKKASFVWLLDEKLLARGDGLKETSFTASKPVGDTHFLRVTIKLGDESFENAVRIPVERPQVVVETGTNGSVPAGSKINLISVPYFFNASSFDDFNFSWQVNDEKISGGSSNELSLDVGQPETESQKTIRIISTIENKKNFLEATREALQIKVL